MSLAKVQTRTARSGDECTNHSTVLSYSVILLHHTSVVLKLFYVNTFYGTPFFSTLSILKILPLHKFNRLNILSQVKGVT